MAIGGGAHSTWGTRFGFLMAAIGSSVGLGNFWRFPYVAGENGGAAFIVVYLICVIFIALPILMAELSVGRHARRSAVGSVRKMAFDAGAPGLWAVAGWVSMIAAVLILCFYSVVAGWVIAYVFKMGAGEFTGAAPETIASAFGDLIGDTNTVIGWHTAFMVVTVGIVSLGVTKGIERAVTILMPIFFLMLIALVVYAAFTADMGAALAYLFTPDFSELGPQTFLAALGQAFFSIGVGGAIMITYGSYRRAATI